MKKSIIQSKRNAGHFSLIILLITFFMMGCTGSDGYDEFSEVPQTRASFETDAFITEWLVPENGVITLPLDTNYQYNCVIDWGDDCDLTYVYNKADYSKIWHRYTTAGSYRIRILGTFPSWRWLFNTEAKPYLTKIVQWGNVKFQVLDNGFSHCTNLTSIATGIPDVESYSAIFWGCTGLTSLSDGLFSKSITATDFTSMFTDCVNLRTIPPHLFKNCRNATLFAGAFWNTGLVVVPTGVFENCIKVIDFNGIFSSCSNLTTIPSDLFSSCPNVETFGFAFFQCSALQSIPMALFDNCKEVSDFLFTFMNCTALTGTTPKTGGDELWERAGKPGYPATISGWGCFSGCEGLSNFQTGIDDGWK